jgi:hypothetical protein
MTPTADRLQTTRRRPKTLTHADEHPWPAATRSTPEHCQAARLTCAQRVLDGKLPAKDDPTLGRPDGIGAPTILAMLGLHP